MARSTWHADYVHLTAGLDFTQCHSTPLNPDRGRVEAKASGLWVPIPDPHRIRI